VPVLNSWNCGTQGNERTRFCAHRVPRLTALQKEALAVFAALASSDELRMESLLQPGDIQLLNNVTQQHQRSSFVVRLLVSIFQD